MQIYKFFLVRKIPINWYFISLGNKLVYML